MPIAFLDQIREISDHRVPGMVTYPLDEILLSALVGVLCGGGDWETKSGRPGPTSPNAQAD